MDSTKSSTMATEPVPRTASRPVSWNFMSSTPAFLPGILKSRSILPMRLKTKILVDRE